MSNLLLENKELRREVGYKIAELLAKHGVEVSREAIDAVVDDEEKINNVKEAKTLVEEKNQKIALAQEISSREHIDLGASARHAFTLLTLGDDPAVYEKNVKILREVSDPVTSKERVTKLLNKMYDADMTHMYPESEADAIRLYKEHGADLEEAFNLKFIVENSGFQVSPEFEEAAGFKNKESLYVSINDSMNAVNDASSIFNAILPKDVPAESLYEIMGEVASYEAELAKEGKETGISLTADLSAFANSQGYSKADYEKNQKMNAYIASLSQGGKSFFMSYNASEDIYESFKAGKTPELTPATGVEKALCSPVERKDQRTIQDAKAYLADFRKAHEAGKASFIKLAGSLKGKSLSEVIALREVALERDSRKRGIWDYTFGLIHTIRENHAIKLVNRECADRKFTENQLDGYHTVMAEGYDAKRIKNINSQGLTELPEEVYAAEAKAASPEIQKIDLSAELDDSKENPVEWVEEKVCEKAPDLQFAC